MRNLKISESLLFDKYNVYNNLLDNKHFTKEWLIENVVNNDYETLSKIKQKERKDKINEIIK